jgi:hypothetical protein
MKISLTFHNVEFDPDSDFDSDNNFENFLNSFTVVKATDRLRDRYSRYSFSG